MTRSKLVPDFAGTIHFLHLVFTTFFSRSVPANLLWWGLQLVSGVLMTVLGIYACQWRELRPISIGVGAPAADGGESGEGGSGVGAGEVSRGRGRERDLGAAGEYEMVRMKEMGERDG